MVFSFWYGITDMGLEQGGLAEQGKKVSGGHFFSPRKSPVGAGTQSQGLWTHTHPIHRHIRVLPSGKPLALGQVIDPSPISSAKKHRFSDFPQENNHCFCLTATKGRPYNVSLTS